MNDGIKEDAHMLLQTVEEILEIVKNASKIIIYGAGMYGSALLCCLTNRGYRDKILCIAVSNAFENKPDLLGVPVRSVYDLKRYADTTPVIVATHKFAHDEILAVLKEVGYRNISLFDEACYTQMRSSESGATLERIFMELKEMQKRIDSLESRILEQAEIAATQFAAFAEYKDCHVGRDVVVMGTGPSLSKYVPIEGAVHIGVNGAYRHAAKLDYYFALDFFSEAAKAWIPDIIAMKCKKFIGRFYNDCSFRFLGQLSESAFTGMGASWFFLGDSPTKNISSDIRFAPLMSFCSVIFPAIHFALFTNPRKLYIVGCDGKTKGEYKHFDGQDNVPTLEHEQFTNGMILSGYRKVKQFAEAFYPETEIISINPYMLEGMFRDIYTEREGVAP